MNCLKNMYLDDKINQQTYIKRGLSVLQILILGEGELHDAGQNYPYWSSTSSSF